LASNGFIRTGDTLMAQGAALLQWSIAFAIALAGPVQAQAPVSYSVTYIELKASSVLAGRRTLRAYGASSHKEYGNLSFEVLEEIGRQNRFAILEAWNNRDALNRHYHNENTSRILGQLATMRIAPDDRRMYEGLFTSASNNRSDSGLVYVMTHVDVMPLYKDACAASLKVMQSESLHDHGNIAYNVLRQEHELNHFTVAEIWASRQDFDRHVGTIHTMSFRQKLLPMTGALYDERLFTQIQ
jgi:quinol monooxygenase YgiN